MQVRTDDVVRGDLLRRLPVPDDEQRLLVVSAPGGWGKTTLLRSWVDRAPDLRCCWNPLTPPDNDPVRFIGGLVESARPVIGDLDLALPDPGHSTPMAWAEEALPVLLEAIETDGPAAIMFDDYHLIENPDTHRFVQAMIEQLGPRSLTVLSTRIDPPLKLARLRAARAVSELRSDDLRFTVGDSDQLLRQSFQLELPDNQVRLLVDRTEGWPAAISLAAQSLRTVNDREEFLTRFVATDRLIVDYLAEELLGNLPPEHQAFLHDTSVVEQFVPGLAAELSGQESAEAVVEDLERRGLLLRRHATDRLWYRYHELLRDALYHRLDSDTRRDRHRSAADWYLADSQPRPAIEQLTAAGENGRAIDLIAEHAYGYTIRGRHATVERWITAVADTSEADEGLFLLGARAALYGGWIDQAQAWATRAGVGTDRSDRPSGERILALTMHLSLLHARGLINDAAEVADQLLDLYDAGGGEAIDAPPDDVAECLFVAALALFVSGRTEAAETRFDQCIAVATDSGSGVQAAAATGLKAVQAYVAGDLASARSLAERAFEIADNLDTPPTTLHMAPAYAARLITDETDRAIDSIDPLRRIGEFIYTPYGVAFFHLAEATFWSRAGQRDEAERALVAARDILDELAQPSPLLDRWRDLLSSQLAEEGPPTGEPAGPAALTARELQVLRAFSSNLTQREIGRELFLSFNTIKTYARSAYRKLGVSSRSEAVQACRQAGLF